MASGEKLRVVLDTNVVLDALSPKLPLRGILRALVAGEFVLCVTTEIMLEYEEMIARFYGPDTARAMLEAFFASSHVQKSEVFFRFNLLADLDDNKFLDCAFASNAHFILFISPSYTLSK